MEVALPPKSIRLMKDLGTAVKFKPTGKNVRLPLAEKMYVECTGLSRSDVVAAFQSANVIAQQA